MGDSERWVARLRATPSLTLEALLGMPLSLDVWERGDDDLIVAATEGQLSDLERRRLAEVERLYTVSDWQARAQAEADRDTGSNDGRRRT